MCCAAAVLGSGGGGPEFGPDAEGGLPGPDAAGTAARLGTN